MLAQHGRAHPQALRERVFVYADGGMPVGKIAAALLVSISYVSKALSRPRVTGETTARPQRGHVPRKLTAYLAAIEARVVACPDSTLAALSTWLEREHKVSASLGLLSETVRDLQLTVKKRPFTPPSRNGRTLPYSGPPSVKRSAASGRITQNR